MPTTRPPLHIPALFVGASERLTAEHAALVSVSMELATRIRVFGEESCRRGELQIRRRLDAFLSRYVREAELQRCTWKCRAAACSGSATPHASAMVTLFGQLEETVEATPNRQAIEQLQQMLDFKCHRPHQAPDGLRAQSGMLRDTDR
jgi:hypothetical protein